MTAESIIKINVDDAAFKQFTAAFDKYKQALSSTPKIWDSATDSVIDHGNKVVESTKKVTKEKEKIENVTKKINKAQIDYNKSLGNGSALLKNMAAYSGKIAIDFLSIGYSAAKWLAIGALTGGFGIGALAASASDKRKQAQGLGVTTGELRAASVNFGKYINPESTLSNVSDVQNDLSRRQILTRLGGREGQNSAEMLPALIENAVKKFREGGKTSQYAEATGLTQIFSMEELRRLSSLSEKELNQTITDYQRDRKALSVDDQDSKTMQDFWIQLKRSADQLETGFIKALVPLTPQLTELSKSIIKAVSDFAASKEVKEAILNFAHWIGSEEVKRDLKSFFDGISEIVKILAPFAKVVTLPFKALNSTGKAIGNAAGFVGTTYENWINSYKPKSSNSSVSERFNNPGNLRSWGGVPTENSGTSAGSFAHFKSPEDGIRAMAAQLKLYQNRDHLNTINQIVSKYSPSNENNTTASIANISKMSGFKSNERLDLNDPGTLNRLISAMTKQENSRSNFTPATVNQILVKNSAGSDLVVSTNAMK